MTSITSSHDADSCAKKHLVTEEDKAYSYIKHPANRAKHTACCLLPLWSLSTRNHHYDNYTDFTACVRPYSSYQECIELGTLVNTRGQRDLCYAQNGNHVKQHTRILTNDPVLCINSNLILHMSEISKTAFGTQSHLHVIACSHLITDLYRKLRNGYWRNTGVNNSKYFSEQSLQVVRDMGLSSLLDLTTCDTILWRCIKIYLDVLCIMATHIFWVCIGSETLRIRVPGLAQ